MQELATLTDKHGTPIAVGDEVRVLSVTLDSDMEDDEREMFEFMIGAICEVERVDDQGRAWVTMWWSCGDGNATTSVGLERHQMEIVRR
ncbi:hypothetical protein [Azoarcus olearius]|uniref:DUF2158 domain-containing protein n=1 Tax=Azoarcus sp. (strain BH72) TaxID=418699 RepID=A1KA90_AZOSB|nr:hypothetical protein [Azoarcus olearius]ANQ86288.1 hypothetical protein dqs_3261 [Azoarcus olearius]CAL95746.1 conserved hypothetical protein [Azoarcus olearius]